MREAPSLSSCADAEGGGRPAPSAPTIRKAQEAAKLLDVALCTDAYEAISGADGVVILTEWNEFRALDLAPSEGRCSGHR